MCLMCVCSSGRAIKVAFVWLIAVYEEPDQCIAGHIQRTEAHSQQVSQSQSLQKVFAQNLFEGYVRRNKLVFLLFG